MFYTFWTKKIWYNWRIHNDTGFLRHQRLLLLSTFSAHCIIAHGGTRQQTLSKEDFIILFGLFVDYTSVNYFHSDYFIIYQVIIVTKLFIHP